MKKVTFICYALLPLASLVGMLGVAWALAAFLEIFTNNMTMVKVLSPFPSQVRNENMLVDIGNDDDGSYPGNTNEDIFWFLQISDLHISRYRDYGQVGDLKAFCETTLKNINPSFVIVSGDLTDAKDVTLTGSLQYEDEWKSYASILKECKRTTALWLDVRGNHDSFKVSTLKAHENFYKMYGSSNVMYNDNGVASYIHRTSHGSYAFHGIDLAPDPGPGRPFNFFGIPSETVITSLESVSKSTIQQHNATIWYGHYPLSVTIHPHLLRRVLSSGVAYLCGHLHTFLDWFPKMHAIHQEGFLELELGDWKENRKYRVGVFDHGMFSFVDVAYSNEPIAVVTNPPSAKYLVDHKIPFWKSRKSTHIRFLSFSNVLLRSARVLINDKPICEDIEKSGQLYTCPWEPSFYESGIHTMEVQLQDTTGKQWTMDHVFSLDGTRPPLGLRTSLMLLTDWCSVKRRCIVVRQVIGISCICRTTGVLNKPLDRHVQCRMLFLLTILITVALPVVLRQFSTRQVGVLKSLLHAVFPQYIAAMECDHVFRCMLVYNVFLVIGPNSVGYFVSNQIGVQFSFGIYTGYRFLPGTLTYIYSSYELLLFNSIVLLYIGEQLLRRANPMKIQSKTRKYFVHIMLGVLLCCKLSSSKMYWVAYGKLACLFNPINTWSIPFVIYLVRYIQISRKPTF